jgi:hypothetical protein
MYFVLVCSGNGYLTQRKGCDRAASESAGLYSVAGCGPVRLRSKKWPSQGSGMGELSTGSREASCLTVDFLVLEEEEGLFFLFAVVYFACDGRRGTQPKPSRRYQGKRAPPVVLDRGRQSNSSMSTPDIIFSDSRAPRKSLAKMPRFLISTNPSSLSFISSIRQLHMNF